MFLSTFFVLRKSDGISEVKFSINQNKPELDFNSDFRK